MNKTSAFFPLLCVVVGGLWFLRAMDLIPGTSTIFAVAFIVIGIAVLVLEGITKSSVVSAPLFMYCGVAVYLTENHYFRLSAAIALGVFVLGLVLLLARMDAIPVKKIKSAKHSDTPPLF